MPRTPYKRLVLNTQSAVRIAQLRERYEANKLPDKRMTPHIPGGYGEYLASSKWHYRRLMLMKKRGRRCEACGTVHGLTVHHLTYSRIGNEHDDDLVILCWPCHRKRHALNPEPGQLANAGPGAPVARRREQ